MRRERLRRWAKWGCTLAAVLVVGLAGFSLFRSASYASKNGKTVWIIVIGGGLLVFQEGDSAFVPSGRQGWLVRRAFEWSWGMNGTLAVGSGGIIWERRGRSSLTAGVTLLYPFLLTAVPAGLLWYTDRRRFGVHACQKCGYDRRGLAADAKCPECGAVAG